MKQIGESFPRGRSPSREASTVRDAESFCAGNRFVLWVGDVDGVGGLMAVEMVKYRAKV